MAARARAFLWTLRLSQSEEDKKTAWGAVFPTNDIARRQRWRQRLLDPGAKCIALHGPLDQHRRVDAVSPQPRDEGVVAPVAMRNVPDAGRATGGAPAAPGHLRIEPAFVDEDQLCRVKVGHLFTPLGTGFGDIFPRLFRRDHGLFLCVTP